jgi:hypothetical protein
MSYITIWPLFEFTFSSIAHSLSCTIATIGGSAVDFIRYSMYHANMNYSMIRRHHNDLDGGKPGISE